jgi:hypothetical protein
VPYYPSTTRCNSSRIPPANRPPAKGKGVNANTAKTEQNGVLDRENEDAQNFLREATKTRAMQSFLESFYLYLLPTVLKNHEIVKYGLVWYPSEDDFFHMGNYGETDIEWRSPGAPGNVVPPPSRSTKAQLRFSLENTLWPADDWDALRKDLRTELGCRCSMVWKYKVARFRYENGATKYRTLGQIHQIHGDTFVLALDLIDTITRCQKSGASDHEAVITQIKLTHRLNPQRGHREDSLGEPVEEKLVNGTICKLR